MFKFSAVDGHLGFLCCGGWYYKQSCYKRLRLCTNKWTSLVAQTVKRLPAMRETRASIPGSGRSPGEGNGSPIQYSCLNTSTDGGAWWTVVHGVAKRPTRLSSFTFTFFHKQNALLLSNPLDFLTVLIFIKFMLKAKICNILHS